MEENNNHRFKIVSPFKPTGDQPTAIKQLVEGIRDNKKFYFSACS